MAGTLTEQARLLQSDIEINSKKIVDELAKDTKTVSPCVSAVDHFDCCVAVPTLIVTVAAALGLIFDFIFALLRNFDLSFYNCRSFIAVIFTGEGSDCTGNQSCDKATDSA